MNDKARLSLINFLKSLTRLIVQTNLYSSGHPQVKEAAKDAEKYLSEIMESEGIGEVVLTLDHNKLLFNGEPFLNLDRIPNSLLNLFKKTNCDSAIFQKGTNSSELIAFPKVISSKSSLDDFFKENSIEKIRLKRSIYQKVNSRSSNESSATDTSYNVKVEPVSEEIKEKKFEDSLLSIVSRLTDDQAEQKKIIDALFDKFKKEVEERVNKAVEQIKKEKIKVENDYERAQMVVSNIANGELMVDKNGNVIMMNPQAQTITGKPLKEVAGKKIFDVTNLENQILNLAKELRSENEKKIAPEASIKGKEDLARTVKNSTAIIKNEEGKIVGTISLPTDVARLQEIDKLKDDFISTMTHELRSPLTSIKMALDLISREKLNPSVSNMLNAAIRNSERLNSIISDILDFSKLQSGKMTFNLSDIDPKEPANGAADSMKAWANSKSVTINTIFEENLPKIYADKRRTEQILINLLSNSLKFTPSNGKIDISVYRGKDALSNFVFFSVKDTGCGIKKEEIGRIFDKFVQAASGEKVGGTGLGLAITKAMVVMQGGSISVQSEPGQGAEFTFSLPIYIEDSRKEDIALPEEKPWWKKLLGI